MTDSTKAKLSIPGQGEVELPILEAADGSKLVDIRKLYNETGVLTYDPGFMSTASCNSTITYINGDEGKLLYRGYAIEDLANKSDFLEVAYLLMNGELPNIEERQAFEHSITYHTMVHEQLRTFYQGFRRDAHPMAIMVGVVGALSSFYHNNMNMQERSQRMTACYRIIGKMATLAAMAYKYSIGQPFVYPKNGLKYSENLLYMLFKVPAESYHVNPVLSKALDRILILHADHEQNASTSTVRLAGSSGANPFVCIASGIATLWGPAHGGANEAVLNMLKEIGSKDRIGEFINKAKDKSSSFRLMGFGHRVYKNYDPRASLIRQTCHEVLDALEVRDEPLLELAMELERIALQDDYFVSKKLYPNVDFYSGIILQAMGIPVSMFTVLFAVARTVGWISQWLEMIEDPNQKIGRPRQLYNGALNKTFVPLHKR